jgi:hypothetical protein
MVLFVARPAFATARNFRVARAAVRRAFRSDTLRPLDRSSRAGQLQTPSLDRIGVGLYVRGGGVRLGSAAGLCAAWAAGGVVCR